MKPLDGDLLVPGAVAGMEQDLPMHRLLLALLSVEVDGKAVEALVAQLKDWPGFLALCHRHRVMSLAAKRLLTIPTVPTDVADVLRQEQTVGLALSLQQVAEARRLVAVLQQGGVACAVLKGAPLSIRAFGDLASRDARDIDLLVDPAALPAAVAALEAAGLVLVKPKGLGWRVRALYLRYSHECVLRTPTGLTIEIKARLHPTARLMPGRVSDVLERCVTESVGGTDLPTLAHEEALLYLCCHGARHAWFRHKWLVDIAFLAHGLSAEALGRAVDEAYRGGVEVPVLEALLMAHEWLGAAVPDDILDLGRAHALVRGRRPMILSAVQEQAVEVLRNPPLGHGVERSEYLLRSDWGYRWAVLERHFMVRVYGLLKALRART